jgi:putative ABC transport system permease protein
MIEFLAWANSTLYAGLPYCIVTISFVLTYRYISFPDLTCAGTFVAGGAAAAVTAVGWGLPPLLSLGAAVVVGMIGGLLTALFHVVLRIEKILAGILSAFTLYSLCMHVLTPTLAYGRVETVFTEAVRLDRLFTYERIAWHPYVVAILLAFVVLAKILVDAVLASEFGLALRALEDELPGERRLKQLGLSPGVFKSFALAIGNGLVGLGGALVSMQDGAANLHRGFDVLITGLVAFLLGTQLRDWLPGVIQRGSLFPRARLAIVASLRGVRLTTLAVLGALIYFGLVTISHRMDIPSEYTRLALVFLVAATVGNYDVLGSAFQRWRRKARAVREQGQKSNALRQRQHSQQSVASVSVEALAFTYPSESIPVVREVDLAVVSGEIVLLRGGNGSGKSTLLKLIAGVLEWPDSGTIAIEERDLTHHPRQRRQKVAYLAQDAHLAVVNTLTLLENLALAGAAGRPSLLKRALPHDRRDRIRDLLARFGLTNGLADSRLALSLSGGQRQLINILSLLSRSRRPTAVLLDEPFNNLDRVNAERCWRAILELRGEGVGIVLVNHLAAVAAEHDRLVEIDPVAPLVRAS